MFIKIRSRVITLSLLTIYFTAFAMSLSAQEVLQPSPTPRPTLSPTISPSPSVSPTVSPSPSPAADPTATTPQPAKPDVVRPSTPQPTVVQPPASVYKNIKIGTTREEVRSTLGKAVIDDDDGLFYQLTDEMVQIRLDKDKKVRLIAVTYTSSLQNAPKYSDLFASEPVPSADGSIYHLQRFEDAGYWVSYSKTAGESPRLTVTMQKL